MNNRAPRQRQSTQRRRKPGNNRPAVDIWRETGPLPELEPVTPASDATALIRSLGEPPLPGGAEAILHFATVVERTAAMASALALSAGLLATPDA